MSEKCRMIFFGASDICLKPLKAIIKSEKCELVGIITQPDKSSGRGQKLSSNVVAKFAEENGILCFKPEKLDDEAFCQISNLDSDIAIVLSYGHILKKKFLDLPPLGMWNLHASILPKYRGASPINACIAAGEKTTGVTLMQMVEAMDAGAIVDILEVNIDEKETAETLKHKLSSAAADVLIKNLHQLISKTAKLTEQNHTEATYTKKLKKEDGLLNFEEPAEILERKIRALTPWPGSYFMLNNKIVKIHEADVKIAQINEKLGTIVSYSQKEFTIATGQNLLSVKKLQKEGGKIMTFDDFVRGNKMSFEETTLL